MLLTNIQIQALWDQRLKQSRKAFLRNYLSASRRKLLESKGSQGARGAVIARLASIYISGGDISKDPEYLNLVTETGEDILTEVMNFVILLENVN